MHLSSNEKVVIIGGGQAAAQSCASLRQFGFDGEIKMICEESAIPYQRPPLSKAYLKGEMPEERLWFKPRHWYADNGIDLDLGVRAEAIQRSERIVKLSNGGEVQYDALILATGSRPRPSPIPGSDQRGVHEIRSLADVQRLQPAMIEGRRALVIGGGYIGLEAAAVARQMGLDVTLIEMAPRVLARVAGEALSAFYEAEHRRQGVTVRTGLGASRIEDADAALQVTYSDGTEAEFDLILIGIGIVPNVEVAAASGLAEKNGILVGRDSETNDPRIYAAGDCTARWLPHYGRRARLESVHNAIEQAKLAAAALTGKPRPAEDVPWFWSDQYDLKLQIAGLSAGHDQAVLRGSPADRKFAVFYLRNGQLLAVDAVNDAPSFLMGKKLIQTGARLAPDEISDTSLSIKEIAQRAAA